MNQYCSWWCNIRPSIFTEICRLIKLLCFFMLDTCENYRFQPCKKIDLRAAAKCLNAKGFLSWRFQMLKQVCFVTAFLCSWIELVSELLSVVRFFKHIIFFRYTLVSPSGPILILPYFLSFFFCKLNFFSFLVLINVRSTLI